jgi:hypothetical protein
VQPTHVGAHVTVDCVVVLRGHSNISTTADVYAHLTPAMLERSAARMDAILGRRREATSG